MDLSKLLSVPADQLAVRQEEITTDRIQDVLGSTPRRFRLVDFDRPLKEPYETRPDQHGWNLILPFKETFVRTFEYMCRIDHVPFRFSRGGVAYTFINDPTPQEIQLVKNWISTLDRYVAHRDCLSVSFAVDFDCVDGNPDNARTDIAALRQRAKPYERAVTKDTINAADQLADVLLDAVEKITIYSVADAIVAMPPSRPKVEYSLPQHLAKRLSMKLGIEDLSQHAVTKADRPAIKSVARDLKLSALEGTITVDETAFKGRCCIIVDDLYQSGASMNYFAMLLQRAGAIGTLGLACEKTCRNDDNLLRRQ